MGKRQGKKKENRTKKGRARVEEYGEGEEDFKEMQLEDKKMQNEHFLRCDLIMPLFCNGLST